MNNFSENIKGFMSHLHKTYFAKDGKGSPPKDKKEEEL
jgi:hypothetical protein